MKVIRGQCACIIIRGCTEKEAMAELEAQVKRYHSPYGEVFTAVLNDGIAAFWAANNVIDIEPITEEHGCSRD